MASSEEQTNKKKGTNWIGILIFLLIFFGSTVVRGASRLLSQITGGSITIGTDIIPFLVLGLIGLTVLFSIVQSVRRFAQRNEIAAKTGLPTTSSPASLKQYTGSPTSLSQYTGSPASLKQYTGSPTSLSQYTSKPASLSQRPAVSAKPEPKKKTMPTSVVATGTPPSDDPDMQELVQLFAQSRKEETFSIPARVVSGTANRLPKPPRFEPIISGKVVILSILGFLLLAGGVALVGVMSILLS